MLEPISVGDVFGWFSPGQTRRGVILCGTHGYEQHCAHRSWRALSERIAASGCATLRFDYPGEGDSGGRADRLEAWLDSIRRAVAFMRYEAGMDEIVLVGLRLGGTMAALVAAEGGVDRLVLLAPFATGRAYLREMELQARTVNLFPDWTPMPREPGVVAVGGFRLGDAFVRDLSAVDLAAAGQAPAPHVLLLGSDPSGLAARYAATGCTVEAGPLPGLSRLISNALHTEIAEEAVTQVMRFAAEGAAPRTPGPRLARSAVAIAGEHWREEPVRFGAGQFGILSRPHAPAAGLPAVLFINMGANVHSGYGRQTTNLARELAEQGVCSLRMDLLGVGDSPDRPDGQLPLYRRDAVADVRAAVDCLRSYDMGPIVAVGICNGAYLGFHALCEDHRIAAGVLVNMYCFDWELAHDGASYGAKPTRALTAYMALLTQKESWKRILSGKTPVHAIIATLAKRWLKRQIQRTARPFAAPAPDTSIAARIAGIRQRGAKLLLIYSGGDLGLTDLRRQLGSLDRASALLGEPVRVVEGTDHSFGSKEAQQRLTQEVQALLNGLTKRTPLPVSVVGNDNVDFAVRQALSDDAPTSAA